MKSKFLFQLIIIVFLFFWRAPVDAARTEDPSATGLKVRFFFTPAVSSGPVNGRIILAFQNDLSAPVSPDVFHPQPTFAIDVVDWRPGQGLTLDAGNCEKWIDSLDALDGWYAVQGLLATTRSVRPLASGAFPAGAVAVTSKNIVHIEKGRMSQTLDLLFHVVPNPPKFRENEQVRELVIPSPLLSSFYGEPESLRVAVILPESYQKDPTRLYPSVYVFGGWNSTPLAGLSQQYKRYGMGGIGGDKIFIFVDHECRSGYHVFCSSPINGPREASFLQELIPAVEKSYRVKPDPRTRFLMGQSSGAWAGLWLLIGHPESFAAVFAAAPDPLDFSEFIGTDIYKKGANLFVGPSGEEKFFSASGRGKELSLRVFTGLDRIAGWGEQMHSFDAAFSPKGADGVPLHLFDWRTGTVDPQVARAWRDKDLSLVVQSMNRRACRALDGKLHIFVSEQDDFGLDRAVRAFQRVILKKGIAAEIRFIQAAGHDVWTDDLRQSIHQRIDQLVLEAGVNR